MQILANHQYWQSVKTPLLAKYFIPIQPLVTENRKVGFRLEIFALKQNIGDIYTLNW